MSLLTGGKYVVPQPIDGQGQQYLSDVRTRLVDEENLRLRERVMRLEAQVELIANKTDT